MAARDMRTEHEARLAFVRQFNALLDRHGVSARALRQTARAHGIGYSTLQSWRTGEHLPRVPDDNPCFRGFIEAIATNHDDIATTMAVAITAWRRYVAAKRARIRLGSAALCTRPPDLTPAYRGLTDTERAVFRRIAESPCRDLTAPAVAALADLPTAEPTLRRLTTANLLRRDDDRYSMHDAVRLFGRQRAAAEDTPLARSSGIRRLAAFYGRQTTIAATTVYPDMPLLVEAMPDRWATRFESDRHATSWLITERANVLATASAALGEHADLVCAVADALRAFQQVLPHSMDWTSIAEAGLRAAQDAACPERTAAMRLATAAADSGVGRFGSAIAHLRLAYETYRGLRKPSERAHVCLILSMIEHATGDLRSARAHCAESLRLRRGGGQTSGQTSSLVFLADIDTDLGHVSQTERKARAALALGREVAYTAGVAGALGSLGRIALERRSLDDANRHFSEQLAVSDEHALGSRKAIALVGLARVHQLTGHHEEAGRLADTAAVTARDWGNAAAYVDALNVAGAAHLCRGRYNEAFSYHRRAGDDARRTGYRRGHAESLAGLEHARQRVRWNADLAQR